VAKLLAAPIGDNRKCRVPVSLYLMVPHSLGLAYSKMIAQLGAWLFATICDTRSRVLDLAIDGGNQSRTSAA
jgi:hypothetical protein